MKIRFDKSDLFFGLNIALYYDANGKRYIAKPIELVFEELPECSVVEPTLKVCQSEAIELLQSMAEELDKKGIDTEKDAKIKGTLEATRVHLQDLRKLLKLESK